MTTLTKDEIIALAKKSGFKASIGKTDKEGSYHPNINALSKDVPIEWLEKFATLCRTPVDAKPVAWLSVDSIGERFLCFSKPNDNDKVIPLYAEAAPAAQPLTDEWIRERCRSAYSGDFEMTTTDEFMRLADAYAKEVADTPRYHSPLERALAVTKIGKARGALETALNAALAPVKNRPTINGDFIQHIEAEDGFAPWTDPSATGYLLACCDCGLVHEMEFRVAKFADAETNHCEILDDPNTKAQFRAKRRDDIRTRPAPLRELSDSDLIALENEVARDVGNRRELTIAFAQAILKAARGDA